MRILQLHTRYRQRGGEDEVVDAEARALEGAGHEVRQLILHNPQGSFAAAAALTFSPWNPRTARLVRRVVEEFQPDVTHVHNTWYAMSPSVTHTLKEAGMPVVMTLHNYRLACANALLLRDSKPCELCVTGSPWQAVLHNCYRDSRAQSIAAAATVDLHRRRATWSTNVDLFIVVSDFQRRIMHRAGLPQRRMEVVPHSVADPGPRNDLPSASNSVLYVGRLSHEKGVSLLAEAWRRVQSKGLRLTIVGEGPLARTLLHDLPPDTDLLGYLPTEEVQKLMLQARLGVLPSQCYEVGFPLTLLEYLAAGVPVLVSANGAMTKIGESLGREWTVKGSSPAEWTRALETVLERTDLVDGGHLAARALFQGAFTVERHIGALLDAYERAMRLNGAHGAPNG